MCVVNPGDVVYLIKDGLVRFEDGSVYLFKDCKLRGGTLVLGVGEVKSKPKPKPKPKVEGEAILEEINLGSFQLKPLEVKTMMTTPVKEEKVEPPTSTLPLAVLSVAVIYALKKVLGLDRKLKQGSCEVRHQEAITRIAKLEGKVLRKQIVDGAKLVKGKLDEKKSKGEGSDKG